MTKKDFEAIAYMLKKELNSNSEGTSGEATVFSLAQNLSDYFSEMNPRFKRDVFYKACGLNSNATERA